MTRLIIAPWEADDRARTPENFAFGLSVSAPSVESPDEPPARERDASDEGRNDARSPRFLTHHAGDLDLARELGCSVLRLSMSWARLQPGARGSLRKDAVSAYRRVVEAAMARGMRPILTLCDRDAPGRGWLEPDAAARFGDYASAVAREFPDAEAIVPIDEPSTECLALAFAGAPPLEAARVLARACLLGAEAVRASGGAALGMSVELATAFPASAASGDVAAARFCEAARTGAWLALASGRGGALLSRLEQSGAISPLRAQMLAAIDAGCSEPAAVLLVRPSTPERVAESPRRPFLWDAQPLAHPAWEPWVPLLAACMPEEGVAGPKVFVVSRHAEDAASPAEKADDAGRIADAPRVAALRRDAEAWRRAAAAGVPLAGWFASDLLDGFQPGKGDARTGLIATDPFSGRRTVKASGVAFRKLVSDWT